MGEPVEYAVSPERSTVVIEARTSVGPVAWELNGVEGWFRFAVDGDAVDTTSPVEGRLDLEVGRLTSNNRVYDGELLRRVDARRHPRSTVELLECTHIGNGSYGVRGAITFHGVRVVVSGDLMLERREDGRVLVTGEHSLDVRDFQIPPPTMLMLKIYPDVRVVLVVEGRPV